MAALLAAALLIFAAHRRHRAMALQQPMTATGIEMKAMGGGVGQGASAGSVASATASARSVASTSAASVRSVASTASGAGSVASIASGTV